MPNFKADPDNQFAETMPGVESPAIAAYSVTPSDSVDLTQPIRQVTINGSGTISYVSSIDGNTYGTNTPPVGPYPMFAKRIRSTGTTATEITGWA